MNTREILDTYQVDDIIRILVETGIYPHFPSVDGCSTDTEIVVDGHRVVNCCSSNYLGLAGHPKVREAAKRAIDRYGLGTCGSRFISGNLDVHQQLEEAIADFKGCEDAIVFSTGTLANMGSIPGFINPPLLQLVRSLASEDDPDVNREGGSVILCDRDNHASILDACKLAGVTFHRYHHRDMENLEKRLKDSAASFKLIVTDGIFSAEGDIAPLDKIVALARQYGAVVMVDDAHATGVMGATGRGTSELFGVEDDIPLKMGTLSKSFGGIGGFVAGDETLIDYLKVNSRTYMFTGALPASVAAGVIAAIQIATEEGWRRAQLLEGAAYVRESFARMGLDTLGSSTHIIPVLTGDETVAIRASEDLFGMGIFAPSFRFPAAPKGKARIRLNLMATHTSEQLDTLIDAFDQVNLKYHLSD